MLPIIGPGSVIFLDRELKVIVIVMIGENGGMSDQADTRAVFNIDCPCCGAQIMVDAASGEVVESRESVDPRKSASLSDAQQLLKEDSARIHDKYRQIVEADKVRESTMDKKFKEFFEKAKNEPHQKPVRDIDLD